MILDKGRLTAFDEAKLRREVESACERLRAATAEPSAPRRRKTPTPSIGTWKARAGNRIFEGMRGRDQFLKVSVRRLAVLPFPAFEAPYFIFFLKYLLASSLSALPGVKRGCRVAGLALKVAGSPVNGLVPLRALVAFL